MKLSEWKMDYAEDIARYANNDKIAKNLMDVFPNPYTLDDAKRYIKYSMGLDNTTHLHRAITIEGKAVGSISITLGSDIHSKSGEVGYWLAEEYWGRGIMKEAIGEMCKKSFDELDIVRINAEVFDYNITSAKVLEKCGFVLEGKLRNSIYKNSEVYDSLMYSLIKTI